MTCLIYPMIDWAIRRRVVVPEPSSHSEDDVKDWAAIGRIYEHLACYYLSAAGFKAEIKDAAGYDILCECPDGKFFKVEVKSSTPRNRSENNKRRIKQEISFGGMKNKAIADVFMFFDRTTNHMHLMFAEEVDCSLNKKILTAHVFSDYHTQLGLSKLSSFVPSDDLAFISPSPKEELKLNRDWVLDNVDLVHQMKSEGIWASTISKVFCLGNPNWIRRICREDRNGITDSLRRKLRISNAYIND